MKQEIQAFLDAVCAQVRCREVHGEVRLELGGHLEERCEMHMGAGLSEQEAVKRALVEMGDPTLIGQQLNETHKPRTEWGLIGATGLLSLLGIWAMYAVDVSASYSPHFSFLAAKMTWSAVGLAVGSALFFLDYRRLRRYSWPLYFATLAGSLALSLFNARGYGEPPGVGHSPMLFAVALAGVFTTWDWDRRWAVLKAIVLFAAPMAIYLQFTGLMSEAVQYALIFGVLLLLSRPRPRQTAVFAGLGLAAAAAVGFHVWSHEYLRLRVRLVFSPFMDPQGAGYQVVQARLALEQAGWWGRGATATLKNLPAVQGEFIFPYLVYTLGWVAGAGILLLIAYFIGRLLLASRQVKDLYGSLLIMAIVTLFAYRFGWNVLMALGLLPVSGVDLPFVSHGLQAAVQLALVGLVLGVFRRKDMGRRPLLPG